MKIKLFTHTDLDGVGCAIVANRAYGKDNVTVTYCDYGNVNEKIASFITLEAYKDYDMIFITDIHVNEQVAEMIDTQVNYTRGVPEGTLSEREENRRVILLDHHASASWLNKYWWANVTPVKLVEYDAPSFNGEDQPVSVEMKTAGTSMLYDYVINQEAVVTMENARDLHFLFRLVEKIRRYDTWEWYNIYNDEYAKALNDLLYLIGREKFVDRFTNDIAMQFTETEKIILQVEQQKIKDYIEKAQIVRGRIAKYDVGFVFAEQYISELGNVLAENNPDLAFIVIINLNSANLSFRTVRDDIDLGKDIASVFGGGGHPKAAGAKFDKKYKADVIEFLIGGFVDANKSNSTAS